MKPNEIDRMGLADLVAAERILKKRLEEGQSWVDAQRGRDYVEFERREKIHMDSPYHGKLKKVTERILHVIENLK